MRLLITTLALLFVSSTASSATLQWDCNSQSDPDYTHVKLFSEGNKVIAALFQGSGDGDEYAEDVIEMRRQPNSNAVMTFVQVPNLRPSLPREVRQPSRKTRGAVLSISPITGEGTIGKGVGPTGSDLSDDFLDCHRAKGQPGIQVPSKTVYEHIQSIAYDSEIPGVTHRGTRCTLSLEDESMVTMNELKFGQFKSVAKLRVSPTNKFSKTVVREEITYTQTAGQTSPGLVSQVILKRLSDGRVIVTFKSNIRDATCIVKEDE